MTSSQWQTWNVVTSFLNCNTCDWGVRLRPAKRRSLSTAMEVRLHCLSLCDWGSGQPREEAWAQQWRSDCLSPCPFLISLLFRVLGTFPHSFKPSAYLDKVIFLSCSLPLPCHGFHPLQVPAQADGYIMQESLLLRSSLWGSCIVLQGHLTNIVRQRDQRHRRDRINAQTEHRKKGEKTGKLPEQLQEVLLSWHARCSGLKQPHAWCLK